MAHSGSLVADSGSLVADSGFVVADWASVVADSGLLVADSSAWWLKPGFSPSQGLVQFNLFIVVTVTVRGNDPSDR